MIFGDAAIVIQNMFRITPKALNPINMIVGSSPTDERLGMIDRMMFAIPFQGLVAPKGIGIVNRAFPRLGLDMPHQFVGTDRLDHFGIDPVFPLQKPKHDAFPGGRSATFALPFAPKVSFVQFDLAFEFATFQLGQMEQGFPQSLVHPRDDFDINAQILSQPIRRLQLVEALEDHNLPSQTVQTFALPTELAFYVPATGVNNLKGSTKNILTAPQKVGRTTKNRVSSSNHAPVLAHTGYETP